MCEPEQEKARSRAGAKNKAGWLSLSQSFGMSLIKSLEKGRKQREIGRVKWMK